MSDDLKDRIYRRLEATGLNPNSAAESAGLDRDFVRSILRDKSKEPTADRMMRLSRALKCRLEWLLTGEGPETDESSVLSPAERAMLDQMRRLPPEEQARALKIARSLEPDADQDKRSDAAS